MLTLQPCEPCVLPEQACPSSITPHFVMWHCTRLSHRVQDSIDSNYKWPPLHLSIELGNLGKSRVSPAISAQRNINTSAAVTAAVVLLQLQPQWLLCAGVDVFCIAPGAIDTPMFQASSLNHLSDSQRADFIGSMGQARLIPPREIAEQIFFLCRLVLSPCSCPATCGGKASGFM